MNIYPGLVAITSHGAYAIESTRGSVNIKGFKIENGMVTDKLYTIPRAALRGTREKTESERTVEMFKPLSVDLGTVVRFKTPLKGYDKDALFVVFKLGSDGRSFNAVLLGGDPTKRYVRSVRETAVEVVDVSAL